MRRLIEIATERRVTVVMLIVAVGLFGMVSLSRLNLNLLPDVSYPTVTIRTELAGAAPVEVENLVTKPIEESVGVIRNVRLVRSVSRSGQSDVTLEFLWGTDMDVAGVEVREKLDLLFLPLEASRPLLLRFDPSSEPIVRLGLQYKEPAQAAESAEARLKSLRRLAEDRIKTDLEAEEGTAAVKVSGGLEDEIQIQVHQQKLSQLGIGIEEVAERIRAENVNLSGGRLEEGDQRFLVRTLNEFESVSEFSDAIVAYVAGRPVYLRDIATVERGYKEREAITRVRGRESVELAIYKEGDANTVQVANRLEERLDRVRESLPGDIELVKIYDQSRFISSAVDNVKNAAFIGGIFAIIVLYGFLRDSRSTTIVGIAIPDPIGRLPLLDPAVEVVGNESVERARIVGDRSGPDGRAHPATNQDRAAVADDLGHAATGHHQGAPALVHLDPEISVTEKVHRGGGGIDTEFLVFPELRVDLDRSQHQLQDRVVGEVGVGIGEGLEIDLGGPVDPYHRPAGKLHLGSLFGAGPDDVTGEHGGVDGGAVLELGRFGGGGAEDRHAV
ncbi:MAG: efflux RND transporter permease subunit, partial [Deltaproteobacteria bacterium]|nr:efflux RND transporter permease subunit [Deltaproteobacteria bacterium]